MRRRTVWRRPRHLAPAILAALGLFAGCGWADGRDLRTTFDPTTSDMTVDEARLVPTTPLFWLGTSFEGLPLISILGDGSLGATFIYGDCAVPATQRDGGCSPPLQVQTARMCRPRAPAVRIQRRTTLRGVPAGSRGGGLVVLSRDVEIRVFADGNGRGVRAIRAMEAINPAAPGAVRADQPLPAPPPGADRRTPCP